MGSIRMDGVFLVNNPPFAAREMVNPTGCRRWVELKPETVEVFLHVVSAFIFISSEVLSNAAVPKLSNHWNYYLVGESICFVGEVYTARNTQMNYGIS